MMNNKEKEKIEKAIIQAISHIDTAIYFLKWSSDEKDIDAFCKLFDAKKLIQDAVNISYPPIPPRRKMLL